MKTTRLLTTLALGLLLGCNPAKKELPNILWITSEDNMPMLGCYGDEFATTPNLDRLASEGFLYTSAYANAPVCAPARNTLLTGVHACSNGNEQMRSRYPKSDLVVPYPQYLRELGYYCTNNRKTDYNYANPDMEEIWDETSGEAHYRNRAEGQPFFAIFNFTTSHESSIHTSVPDSLLRHRPEEVALPPYHPDTPEMRHDWAQYYDKVEEMDRQVGEVLAELEREGLAGNTIVFYYSDHGGVLGRSKRFLYETGTHVPLIIRIPEKYSHLFPEKRQGSRVGRLVSFVDLAPTVLSLAGIRPPGYMQGSAFLGRHTDDEPEYVYMFRDRMDERYDMSRSLTDGEYRYTRNFNPNRIWLQRLEYLWRAPSMQAWEREYKAGNCNEVQARWWKSKPVEELYHTASDPWEVNNLAGIPEHSERLEAMREACIGMGAEMKDAGFIPEAERIARTAGMPAYEYMRSEEVPFDRIQEAAFTASASDPANASLLAEWLGDDDSAVRYWAAYGLLLLGDQARPHMEAIRAATRDRSWNVCVAAAETLYLLGETEQAKETYRRVLQAELPMARVSALNSIDMVDASPGEYLEDVAGVLDNYDAYERQYDARAVRVLLLKWGIDPESVRPGFEW